MLRLHAPNKNLWITYCEIKAVEYSQHVFRGDFVYSFFLKLVPGFFGVSLLLKNNECIGLVRKSSFVVGYLLESCQVANGRAEVRFCGVEMMKLLFYVSIGQGCGLLGKFCQCNK